MTESHTISFVIPVRNDAARLKQCLEAIETSGTPAHVEVIVADNGSDDGSAGVAEAAGATVISVAVGSVAHLRNVAAARACGALLAFVDADHVIDRVWVSSALNVFSDPNIAAAGAPYLSPVEAKWVQQSYGRLAP